MTLRHMIPVQLPLPPDLLAAIDNFRFERRIGTRTEAMRELLRAGLDAAQRKPVRRKEAA
jgi:metal-responsive CopG/Arc/MetJ family transcriptional regulator